MNVEVVLPPPGTTNWRVLGPGVVLVAIVYVAVNDVKLPLGVMLVKVIPCADSAVGQMFVPAMVMVPVDPADAADGFNDVIDGPTAGQIHNELAVGDHAVLRVFRTAVNMYFPI